MELGEVMDDMGSWSAHHTRTDQRLQMDSDGEPLHVLKCKHCGGIDFRVAVAAYATATKCIGCGVESVVHDG